MLYNNMHTLHSSKALREATFRKNGKLDSTPRTVVRYSAHFGGLFALFPPSLPPIPSLPSHPLVTLAYCPTNPQPLRPEGSSTRSVI